jgi:hypothetical protein
MHAIQLEGFRKNCVGVINQQDAPDQTGIKTNVMSPKSW